MPSRYFDIKESDIPSGLVCNHESANLSHVRCLVKVTKTSDAEALAVKGTELTKVEAKALRNTWDEDFPDPF